ncbi:SseB family protein [Micromonospora sp. NPDC051006]|uniref:SseB family protein n=1 Tax=Micromonospora sp. NPDC051006 TaxID=3364283 RepID=UPI0037AFEC1B
MTPPTWPEITARLRDTLARCARDTDLELSAGPRGIRLLVRREVVRVLCPGYDEARLAALGWRRPIDEAGWWYETTRSPERLDWLSAFVTRTAAEVLTADPGALSCRPVPPVGHPSPPPVSAPRAAAETGPTPATASAPTSPTLTGPATGSSATPPAATGPATGSVAMAPAPTGPTSGSVVAAPAPTGPAGEPAVARLLAAAAERQDLPGYLGVLAGATVCVPLAGEPSPEDDFPWTVVGDATGAPLLPVFTSPQALAAFAGDGVPFVALPCAELLADWPDASWGLAVDPGSARAVALAAPTLTALLAANPPPE